MPLKKVLQKSLRMLSWIIRSVFALHSEWKRTLFGKAQKVAHLCWFLSMHPLFSPFYFFLLHILLKVCDFPGQHVWYLVLCGTFGEAQEKESWSPGNVVLQIKQQPFLKAAIGMGQSQSWVQPVWPGKSGHTGQSIYIPQKAHAVMAWFKSKDAMLR